MGWTPRAQSSALSQREIAQFAQARSAPYCPQSAGSRGVPARWDSYRDESGRELFAKRRAALGAENGRPKYLMPRGQPATLHGLDRLRTLHTLAQPTIIWTESETDAWCLWAHELPALAVPGASAARVIMAEHVRGIRHVYVCKHADAAGEQFVAALAERLRMVGYEGEPGPPGPDLRSAAALVCAPRSAAPSRRGRAGSQWHR
jgi:hypothetical protein